MQEIIRNFEYYKFHLEEQKNPIYIFTSTFYTIYCLLSRTSCMRWLFTLK